VRLQGIGRSGTRISFSVVDQFLDHTLGVAFGVARLDSPIQEKQYQAWYWGRNNGPPGSNTYEGQGWAGHVDGIPDFAVSEEGNQARAKSLGEVRTGLMSVLEWAPNESFHSELDLFYSKFTDKTSLNGLQWSSSPWDGINYGAVHTTPSNVVTDGRINGLKPIIFVLNNAGYMVERALEANPDWVYNDLAPWNYHALPAALGCRGWFTAKVTTLGELDAAIARAATGVSASYIEVVAGRLDFPAGLAMAHQRLDALYGND
jgi:hypothetical protein